MRIEEIQAWILEYQNYQNKADEIYEKLDEKIEFFIKEKESLIKEKFLEKFNKQPNIITYTRINELNPIVFCVKGLEYVYLMDDGNWVKYILNYYNVPFDENSDYFNDIYTVKGVVNGIDCAPSDKCSPDIEIISINK